MRWLAATLALVAASAALVAGIYFRDRDTSGFLPAPRIAANADARAVMFSIGGTNCGRRCSYRLLGSSRPDHWLAQIVDRSRTRCVEINIRTFGLSIAHGISGVGPVDCESLPALTQGG
jgi:hypothetical protein